MYSQHLFQLFQRHKSAFTLTIGLGLTLLVISIFRDAWLKTCVFMLTMVGCFLVSEFIFLAGKFQFPEWRIKSPRQELSLVVFCVIAGLLLAIIYFTLVDRSTLPRSWHLVFMILRTLFIFPVAVLIYFLALKRYTLQEVGFQLKNWFVALPLIVLMAGVSYFFFPEDLQFESTLQREGYVALILTGFLIAAFPEEILRNFFQTRLSKVTNNKALGWYLASFVWALSHIPFFGSNSGDYGGATWSAIGIMPIGLLWGYLNQRYHSIIPAVLIHGTNLWGLQNIL